jgi:hypothetical protein
MFVKHFLTLQLKKNLHYIQRYTRFIASRPGVKIKYQTHLHHILPKAAAFFPQFKNLKENTWNGIHLTAREHFIAHRLLHRAFPGSSQTRAFYLICNETGKMTSRAYAAAKQYHIEQVLAWHRDPVKSASRAAKISSKLKGVAKSADHIAKLIGHDVAISTREKLRLCNTGKKATDEARAKMVKSRTGVKRGPSSQETKTNISIARKAQNRKWFNNGIVSMQFSDPPDISWVRGRLPWK